MAGFFWFSSLSPLSTFFLHFLGVLFQVFDVLQLESLVEHLLVFGQLLSLVHLVKIQNEVAPLFQHFLLDLGPLVDAQLLLDQLPLLHHFAQLAHYAGLPLLGHLVHLLHDFQPRLVLRLRSVLVEDRQSQELHFVPPELPRLLPSLEPPNELLQLDGRLDLLAVHFVVVPDLFVDAFLRLPLVLPQNPLLVAPVHDRLAPHFDDHEQLHELRLGIHFLADQDFVLDSRLLPRVSVHQNVVFQKNLPRLHFADHELSLFAPRSGLGGLLLDLGHQNRLLLVSIFRSRFLLLTRLSVFWLDRLVFLLDCLQRNVLFGRRDVVGIAQQAHADHMVGPVELDTALEVAEGHFGLAGLQNVLQNTKVVVSFSAQKSGEVQLRALQVEVEVPDDFVEVEVVAE